MIAAIALPLLAAQACTAEVTVPQGREIRLVTAAPLSSNTNVKGDMVALAVAEDVLVDGVIAIPRGTPATGQVEDARKKGAMGMAGRLTLRPLYLRAAGAVVRLTGATGAKGDLTAGSVAGLVLLSPGFTGRTATIEAGSAVPATVYRNVTFRIERPC